MLVLTNPDSLDSTHITGVAMKLRTVFLPLLALTAMHIAQAQQGWSTIFDQGVRVQGVLQTSAGALLIGTWNDGMYRSGDDGVTFDGFLALPDAGSGPGVLVIQEIFGVTDHIRELADGFAREELLAVRFVPALPGIAREL